MMRTFPVNLFHQFL